MGSEVPMLCSSVAEGAVAGAVASVVAPGAGASINSKSEVPVLLRSGVAEGAAARVVSPEAGASVSGKHSGTYPEHATPCHATSLRGGGGTQMCYP